MRILALAAGLLLLQDDEARIRAFVRQLQDDRIETRDEAAKQLVTLGIAALRHLRPLETSADAELRSRARQIILEIERRERLRMHLRDPARVTLAAEKTPLRDALAELARQSGTEVDVALVPADWTVSYRCKDAGFWDALDGLCRAHGGVRWNPGKRISVLPGVPVACPKAVRGPLLVRLRSVEWRRIRSFGDPEEGFLRLEFDVAWEAGTKPGWAEVRLLDLKDDRGTVLLEERMPFSRTDPREGQTAVALSAEVAPPDVEAAKIARLQAEVHVGFPLDRAVAVFKDPERATDRTQKLGDRTIHLRRFIRSSSAVVCEVQLSHEPDHLSEDLSIVDGDGRAYELRALGRVQRGEEACYSFATTLPEKAVVREFRYRIVTEVHTEIVPFDLRDLPLR